MCKTHVSSVFSFDESPGSFLLPGEEVGGNSYTLDKRGFKKSRARRKKLHLERMPNVRIGFENKDSIVHACHLKEFNGISKLGLFYSSILVPCKPFCFSL